MVCKDDTHVGIRLWYSDFVQHLLSFGFYIHPLWAFHPNHGGKQGFANGNNADDNTCDLLTFPGGFFYHTDGVDCIILTVGNALCAHVTISILPIGVIMTSIDHDLGS